MSDYTIIENICPKDESVKFYNPKRVHFPIPQAEMDKKRFSFVFKSVFNSSLLFLQCELTLCTKKEKDPQKLPKVRGPLSICTVILTFVGEAVAYGEVSSGVMAGWGLGFGNCPIEVTKSVLAGNCEFYGVLENKSWQYDFFFSMHAT